MLSTGTSEPNPVPWCEAHQQLLRQAGHHSGHSHRQARTQSSLQHQDGQSPRTTVKEHAKHHNPCTDHEPATTANNDHRHEPSAHTPTKKPSAQNMQDTQHAEPPPNVQPKHIPRQKPDTAIRLPRGDTTPFWTLPRRASTRRNRKGPFNYENKPSSLINKQHRQPNPRPTIKSSR
jgi:hypothetical protein